MKSRSRRPRIFNGLVPTRVTAMGYRGAWFASISLAGFCNTSAIATDSAHDAVLARGEHIAQYQCSACHIVANDQEFAVLLQQHTPSFSEIANRPGTTAKTLQHFITTTHWDTKTIPMTMPSPGVSSDDAAAVVRYILSLHKP